MIAVLIESLVFIGAITGLLYLFSHGLIIILPYMPIVLVTVLLLKYTWVKQL